MSKKIVISGWYGFGNIGDEAILQAMIDTFRKEYLDCDITVLSYKPEYTMRVQQVNAVHQIPINGVKTWIKNIVLLRWIPTIQAIRNCDIFIMGGGGFLSDWQPEVPKGWLKQMKIAKFFGKKTILYGIGAGPFLTDKGKKETKYYIDNFVDELIVRDKESYRQLKDVVKVKQNIIINIDPVAHMKCNKYVKDRKLDNSISLIYTEYFNSKHFAENQHYKWDLLFQSFCTQIESVIDNGLKPKLVFFQKDIEKNLATKFSDKFNDKIIVEFPSDYKEAINIINQSNAIISFRLHGNILAYALNKPFLPIIYHHKTDGFLEHLDYKYKDLVLEVGDGLNWSDIKIDKDIWYKNTNKFLKDL